jgi:hypothetical protein
VLLFCGVEYAASGAHATLESRRKEKALIRARRTLFGVLLALASLLVIAAPAAVAQIEAANVVFHVTLSGGDTGDPQGQGEAVLRFNPATGTLCYVVVVSGIGEPTEPATNLGDAHIHGPLPGTGIAVDLETDFVQRGTSDVFVAADCVSVNAATLEAILANPSLFYVNIHTVEFSGGAIAGELA